MNYPPIARPVKWSRTNNLPPICEVTQATKDSRKTMRAAPDGLELQRIYSARFAGKTDYRTQVWRVLAPFFGQWFPSTGTVLDLGAGYCESINNASARVKYAMDLNPLVHKQAAPEVTVLQQDCSETWPVGEGELDAVFTSNFLEHLP